MSEHRLGCKCGSFIHVNPHPHTHGGTDAPECTVCTDIMHTTQCDMAAHLANAIRLTVEYVGNDMLPAIEGWVWFDALKKCDPEMVRPFVEKPIHFKNPWNVERDVVAPTDGHEDSGLVAHAKRELELLGEEPETVAGYINVVQAFANMGHSGRSAFVAIPVINQLLQYKNLTQLTDNPDEWLHHDEDTWGEPGGIWQNIRDSECFSRDGGKTYYILSDTDILSEDGKYRRPVHHSRGPLESI